MTWAEIGELVKVSGAVATAAAAWFAAVTAFRGLNRWRAETIGKRNADLAATVLKAVYEMADILRSAREPWVMPHEVSKKVGIPDEVAEKTNFAPERRLLGHQEFFARFRSLKHEYAAVFAADAAKAFDALWRVRTDINHAVFSMLEHRDMGNSRDTEDKKLWDEWYHTAFHHADESKDEFGKRIAEQVEAVESVCRPAIRGQ